MSRDVVRAGLPFLTILTSLYGHHLQGKHMTKGRPPSWTLQDATAQFSEVVRRAMEAGPQFVTRSGDDAVVVVSARDYSRLAGHSDQSLAGFLAASPLASVTLEIVRPRESGRPVKL